MKFGYKNNDYMKRALLTYMIGAGLLATSPPAMAQSDVVKTELAKGTSFVQSGNLDAAENAYQKAYDGAVAIGDPSQACQAAFQLGIVKTTLHKTSDAEKLFRAALQIGGNVLPGNSPFMVLASCLLADLLLTENRPAEAEALYEKAIPNLPEAPAAVAAEKTVNLAICYMRNDQLDRSAQAFEKGIAAFTAIAGADNSQTMAAKANYATLEFTRANYEKAEKLAQQIAASTTASESIKAVATNTLALVYDAQHQYGKALHEAQQSLSQLKNSKSTDSVKEADALLLIGRIYKNGHKYRDAETVIDQALARLAKSPDNPDYSDALREKGDLFVWQGQYGKAEELIVQSKNLREKYLGPEHTDVAQNLADLGYIYQQEYDYTKAEGCYQLALSIYKKTRGDEHPLYIATLAKLGELYRLMGKRTDAESTLNTVLEARRKTWNADSQDTTSSIVALASLYRGNLQTCPQAKNLYIEALKRDDKAGVPVYKKAADLQNLADVQKALGDAQSSAQAAQSAEAIINTLPGAITAKAAIPSAEGKKQQDKKVGEKWCLCVGISNFKDTSINLKYSAKDATDFSKYLVEKGHFKADHVKLLTDEQATRQNLIDQLGDEWLGKFAKPEDLVVIYVSSHGSQSVSAAQGVNFLVTYDTNKNSLLATGIPMQWLSQIIADQVKCQRAIIVLDVCHSGAAADWSDTHADATTAGGEEAADGNKGLQRILTSDPQSIVPGTGQVILCSSAKSQTSWESTEYPNSVFTKQFIDSLGINGATTTLNDSFALLKNKVECEVLRDRGVVQTPQLNGTWTGDPIKPLAD